HALTAPTAYRVMFEPQRKKVYLSFPMSHVMDLPKTLAEIDAFKAQVSEHLTCFDPGDVDEFNLQAQALAALADGHTSIDVIAGEGPLNLKTADVAAVSG